MRALDGWDDAAERVETQLRSVRERLAEHERRGPGEVATEGVAEAWRFAEGAPEYGTVAHKRWAAVREFERVKAHYVGQVEALEQALVELAGEAARSRGLREQLAVYAWAPAGVGALNLSAAEEAALAAEK